MNTPALHDSPKTEPLHPTAVVLNQLQHWADWGWLRHLDAALARLVCGVDPSAPPALALAAACVSALEGQGHTAVPLSVLVDRSLPWVSAGLALAGAADGSATPFLHMVAWLPQTEADWLALLQTSPAVACWRRDAPPPEGRQPLVCVLPDAHGATCLALRRHASSERKVAWALQRRAATTHAVDAVRAKQVLARLFPPASGPDASGDLHANGPDWQAVASEVALRAGLTVVTGGPGTGKTYTAARLLAALWGTHPQPTALRVALAAPTGKAAARLRQSLADGLLGLREVVPEPMVQRLPAAQTLHSLLGARPDTRRLRHHAGHPLDVDVLVVDEASMVHLDLMAALLDALPPNARLVLLGDRDQLASVEAGSVLGDVCQNVPQVPLRPDEPTGAWADHTPLQRQTVMLRQSRRFAGGIGQLARAVNAGEVTAVQKVLAQGHPELVRLQPTQGVEPVWRALDALVREEWGNGYLALLDQGPPSAADPTTAHALWTDWVLRVLRAWEGFRVLCAVHAGDWGTQALNQRVQRVLSQAGCLRGKGEWYAGRPVLVTRNDAALGLSNGDVGLVLPSPLAGQGLKVCFAEGGQVRTLPVGRLAHVETAFAMTVHKSQGSEFGHVALALPPMRSGLVGRELVYTGITRARRCFTLLEGSPGALEAAVSQPTRRWSGLAGWLAAAAQG